MAAGAGSEAATWPALRGGEGAGWRRGAKMAAVVEVEVGGPLDHEAEEVRAGPGRGGVGGRGGQGPAGGGGGAGRGALIA